MAETDHTRCACQHIKVKSQPFGALHSTSSLECQHAEQSRGTFCQRAASFRYRVVLEVSVQGAVGWRRQRRRPGGRREAAQLRAGQDAVHGSQQRTRLCPARLGRCAVVQQHCAPADLLQHCLRGHKGGACQSMERNVGHVPCSDNQKYDRRLYPIDNRTNHSATQTADPALLQPRTCRSGGASAR